MWWDSLPYTYLGGIWRGLEFLTPSPPPHTRTFPSNLDLVVYTALNMNTYQRLEMGGGENDYLWDEGSGDERLEVIL